MYNSITEKKIRQIPQIGEINIDRLPHELTKIYAQVISLRSQFLSGAINFNDKEFLSSLDILYSLTNNLETLLVSIPNHEQKESIAFVAGTAYCLIYLMKNTNINDIESILEIDSISPAISSVIMFLIGNSQADAAEMAEKIIVSKYLSESKKKLIFYIKAIGKGQLLEIIENPFTNEDISREDIQEKALDLLWKEIGIGIYNISGKLKGNKKIEENTSFDRVINLSISEFNIFDQKDILLGPYHLAKLLKILEPDLLKRAVVNIPAPMGIDKHKWESFLFKLSNDRPYLWENHFDAINTNFLNLGTSSILTLPTGSGKSTLAELKIATCMLFGKNIVYLVPTHALEDQVNKNLNSLFSDFEPEYNEFDSEYTEFRNITFNPIQVMTPERCLTLINMESDFFENVGLVVFDEFHLIHGTNLSKERRSLDAMYCLITLFTSIPKADYLLISAMVENGEEIAKWVANVTKRECILFNSSWKPTRQLHGCLVYQSSEIANLKEVIIKEKRNSRTKGVPTSLTKKLHAKPYCLFSLKKIWESKDVSDYYIGNILNKNVLLGSNKYWNLTSNRNKVAAELTKHFTSLGLKTLVFVNTPQNALSTAKEINLESKERKNNYTNFLSLNSKEVECLKMELGNLEYSYLKDGENIGVHHGLLLPLERFLIENYFKQKDGSIALVATATLAQGINLPAEIVIIAGDDRYDDDIQSLERVPPHELLNAAGRAGRAGQCSQGAVIVIPGDITTIDGYSLSSRWWELKNQIFSKSDQCLKVEDPLGFFLDSIQDESISLNIDQTNFLYRFKSETFSELDTKKLMENSFYSFKLQQDNKHDSFNGQMEVLLRRRSELDKASENMQWTKEISFKTGMDPILIYELGESIRKEDFETFINLSVIKLIDWYFNWFKENNSRITKVFSKQSSLIQINKVIGLKSDNQDIALIITKLELFKKLLVFYVQGFTFEKLNKVIPTSKKNDPYLTNTRNFVLRLIPELSFSFGLFSMVIIEIANQNKIAKDFLPWRIRMLASCIREGFDEIEKLDFKRENKILSRVETHVRYKYE